MPNDTINIDDLPITVTFVAKTKRDDWECYEWRVKVKSSAGAWVFPYYCGLGHVTKPKQSWLEPKPTKPTNSDILRNLLSDAEGAQENFSDWCANYGYSDDSIKALNTYKECIEIAANLRKHFGADTVRKLREQLQDY